MKSRLGGVGGDMAEGGRPHKASLRTSAVVALKMEADEKHLQPRQSCPENQGKNSLLSPCLLPGRPTSAALWDGTRSCAFNHGVNGLLDQPQRDQTILRTLKAKVRKLGKPISM